MARGTRPKHARGKPASRTRLAAIAVALLLAALAAVGPLTSAQALDDTVTVRASSRADTTDGFPSSIHYFDVDDETGSVVTIGYCMNMGRHNGAVEVYDAGWEHATGPLAYIAYHGYPNTTTVAGHQLSELGARTATALAVYMQQGYVEPGLSCHVPAGAEDGGGGGYDLADYGPTSVEVRQAALDLYNAAKANASVDGPWNHQAVRVYHAPRPSVQNMLVVERSVTVTLAKGSADATITASNPEYSLAGATYEVRRASDDRLVATVTTDEAGQASCTLAPNERYYVVEVAAPAGYVLNPERTHFETGPENTSVPLQDEPGTVSITVIKRDATAAEGEAPTAPLAGAEFSATDANGATHVAVTGEDGTARFEGLPLGPVSVRETRPPAGYLLDETVHELQASAADLGPTGVVELEVEAPNTPNELVITKVETGSPETTLPGTEFYWWSAEQGDDPELAEGVETLVVDEDGTLRLRAIAPGDWHLKESRPAPGHVADASVRTVHVSEDGAISGDWLSPGGQATATLENDFTRLEVSKRDGATDEELPGAQLALANAAGDVVETWTSGERPHLIERLEPGAYTLLEERAPEGYETAEPIALTLEETGEVQRVTMYDQPVEEEPVPAAGEPEGAAAPLAAAGVAALAAQGALRRRRS